jgi:amino acid adenylation domain-containing protein/FkbH-like protein
MRRKISTLVELLRHRAETMPDRTAYIFLADGESETERLTYAELHRRAKAIGAWLQSQNATGERALLLYPSGLDYIAGLFGCIYGGAIAVPAYPPRHNRTLDRLQGIIADAQPAFALTTREVSTKTDLKALRVAETDQIDTALEEFWHEPVVNEDSLVLLQYTSGSTAAPKGVMLNHANLLFNERLIQKIFQQTGDSTVVGWLPLYHDMGLIGSVLQPLYTASRCVLMPPPVFLQQPVRWLQTISRYHATTSGGPNFAYELCVRKVDEEQKRELDLSTWSVAFNGAEPIRAETVERFAEAFDPCGFSEKAFRPCYGLAEATLIVSGQRNSGPPQVTTHDARQFVSCGRALGQEVIVVNSEMLTECAAGAVGEIWVRGRGVAQGYWNNDDETRAVFDAHLESGEGPYLRTGDLGFKVNEEIFITGRLKDLIIIRGVNHYPQDIEYTVAQAHPSLTNNRGAAFSIEVDGEERLVVIHELRPRRNTNFAEVIQAIRHAVAREHELNVYTVALVKPGAILTTTSGKIQRRACREAFLANGLEVLKLWEESVASFAGFVGSPSDPAAVEPWLQSQIGSRLGLSASEVSIDRPITDFGLDSLKAVEIKHSVEKTLGVYLPLVNLLDQTTIRQLAAVAVKELENDGPARCELTHSTETIFVAPLSRGQRALWFMQRLAPESTAYSIVSALRIVSELNVVALRNAFQALTDRHAMLRTTFSVVAGEPVQRVYDRMTTSFAQVDASTWTRSELEQYVDRAVHRPFDLEAGPLLGVTLLKRAATEHILLIAVHHIISDLWSLAVLLQELGAIYQSEVSGSPNVLALSPVDYKDYVRWQEKILSSDEGARLWSYWQSQLAGDLPVLEIPTDRPRPPVQTYRGTSHTFKIGPELTEKLKQLSHANAATLYMTLLAAFQVLLHRYTNQEDFAVGSPTAGRSLAGLARIIGYFVNPVVVRADLSGTPTFESFLGRVRHTVLNAFDHQDYPFALLVERLQPIRSPRVSPLFQTMFVLQKAPVLNDEGMAALAVGEVGARMKAGGLTLESMTLDQRVAQFDLTLIATEINGGLSASLQYNTDLFDAVTIARMASNLEVLLAAIVANPRQEVAVLPLLSEAEQRRQLIAWNDTRTAWEQESTLTELFERQAQESADAVAVSLEGSQLTYRELNERSNQLARHLMSLGVGSESRVGLLLERSLEMVVGLFGVLKAGGAYVPLDPRYPSQRISYIVRDAGIKVLLTEKKFIAAADLCGDTSLLLLDSDWSEITRQSSVPVWSDVSGESLAYIIYTSGSTGGPKGVMVQHQGLANYLRWARQNYPAAAGFGMPVHSSIAFDLTVTSLLLPLISGQRVVLLSETDGVAALGQALENETGWGLVKLTPANLELLSHQLPAHKADGRVRMFVVGGEALRWEQLRFWQAHAPGTRIINEYGPTETVVGCCVYEAGCEPATTGVPIGRPVANTRLYVLNRELQAAPIGAGGELGISGVAVARGYLGRPDLTAQSFVPDPFSAEPGARLYRTGDVVRYRDDGILEYLGRNDHQVKVRGYRIELSEIESVLTQHESVRTAVVQVYGEQLVAYLVPGSSQPTEQELRGYLQTVLPAYMAPSAFVVLDELPVTRNGKIDRAALPAPAVSQDASKGLIARTPVEEVLAGMWCEVLGLENIRIEENFFEAGGHSLLAAKVVSRIRDTFGVEIPLRSVFETPTIAQLAHQIETSARVEAPPLHRVSRAAWTPLSYAQQRLWFLDQMRSGDAIYNIPAAIRLRGRLNIVALEAALREIVRRHEVLRARFINVNGEPAQVFGSSETFGLRVVDTTETDRLIASEAQHPFDLTCEPLRATLLREDAESFVLMLTVHHIASDGSSADVFVQEIGALYEAYEGGAPSRLAELTVQYADYAVWQREWLSGAVLAQQVSYWKEQLAGAPAVLELPADRVRSGVQSYRGGSERVELSGALRARLEELSRSEGVTLFMTLLAAWQVLLHRYTEQEQVVVGTPIAGRTRGEVEGLIGFFANTLVLRTELSGELSFRELLQRVREVCLGAYSNQDLPFEKLVEELQPERTLSHNPLFQVFFNMFRVVTSQLALPGVTTDLLLPAELYAKFDLSLYVIEQDEESRLELTYNADLFRRERIAEMLEQLDYLLRQIVVEPAKKLADFSLITATAKTLLPDPELKLYPVWTGSVHNLFTQQAKRTPNHTAVVDSKEAWSYLELDRRSNQLAHQLNANHIGPGAVIAVYGHRSASLVCALLGVLKAGAAFMILDPAYPDSYLIDCLRVAEPQGFLQLNELPETVEEFVASLTGCARFKFVLHVDESALEDVKVDVGPNDLSYVAFTSGSTGTPKGIAGEHGPLSHFVQWHSRTFGLHAGDRFSMLSGLSHDPLLRDIFTPLSLGATLCIPDWEETVASGRLGQWMAQEKISVMHLTPPILQLLTSEVPSLRYAFFGGDTLARHDVINLRRLSPQVNCVNFYGATETPQAMAFFPIEIGDQVAEIVPLGRGIEGVQLLVLNRAGQLAGVSEAGEICVRTPYLSRGYLGNDTLTAEKFIPDPFGGGPAVRLYRTGDSGRYLPDGNVEFLGRLDREVKVLGHRVDPEGIEAVLRTYPAVREATVVTRDKSLVAYVVADPETTLTGLRSYLKDNLPQYMVPGVFVLLDALPLTPNGKVDILALPGQNNEDRNPDGSFVPARTPVEEMLTGIWSDLLGIRQPGVHDNFFELGGHSLLATRLISRVRETFGVDVELRSLFDTPTVAGLALRIESARHSHSEVQLPLLPRTARETSLPLSYAQERLWFLDQLAPGNPFYNINSGVRLGGRLQEPALRQSLAELVRRHEVLRTRIVAVDGRAVQEILPEVKLALPLVDLSGLAATEREGIAQQIGAQQVSQGFELAAGGLLRAVLLRLSEAEHWFICTLHHIVSDGWSMAVLVQEIGALYEAYESGEPSGLAELAVQYADYAVWQREWLSGAVLEQQVSYWKEQLAGAPAVLELPADRVRSGVQSYRGGSERVELSGELRARLEQLSRSEGVTLFMTLLAAWQVLLHRYTEQEQVVVGTPIAGRTRGEVEGLIGFFANTLVLRTELSGELSFRELLQRVREVCLGAYSNQDLPFEKLVEELQPERTLSYNPLVQVFFNLLSVEPSSTIDALSFPELTATCLETNSISAKFDLNLALIQTGQGLGGTLEYSSDLFDPARVRRMIDHLQILLQQIVANPAATLSELLRDVPKQKQTIAIAATFTAEPLRESISYWMQELKTPASIKFAPYNQVFQQLLDPSSLIRTNDHGVNIILLRLEDWLRDGNWSGNDTKLRIEKNAADLLQAAHAASRETSTPYFIGLCPLTPGAAADADLSRLQRHVEQIFESQAESHPGIYYLNLSKLAARYRVSAIFDSYANELAHVPFTQEFFAATGTLISRRIFAWQNRPYKVIVLDCDQTLWGGICGEDGPDGVSIGPSHRALQQFMLDQLASGKLLCLCSKNNEDDVFEVFRKRPEMLLQLEHFTGMRINWNAKSENLQSLADELQLSLNSFIFIDDSFLECAEVRARCPEVMTLRVPAEDESIAPFLENVWAFDQLKVTEEDKLRHQLYQQQRERDKLRQDSSSLEHFLAGLELEITIKPLVAQQLERVAQLTQRTNQFNFTGLRRSVAGIEQLLRQKNIGCEVVEVRDRFGDYGLVGVLIFKVESQALEVDTFLLSCRTLGRNVEDTMLVKLAELASANGCSEVHLTLNPTAKNGPTSDFLNRVFGKQRLARNGGFVYIVPTDSIAKHPRLSKTSYGYCFTSGADKQTTISTTKIMAPAGAAESETMQRIASLHEATQIVAAIRAGSRVRQSTKGGPLVAPRTPTEERMADIWMDVLNLDRVGVHDNFFDLGGHSLLATQLLSRVHDVFDVRPSLRTIFETPTIAAFAETISQDQIGQVDPEELAAMLAQLSQVSEEEAARVVQ